MPESNNTWLQRNPLNLFEYMIVWPFAILDTSWTFIIPCQRTHFLSLQLFLYGTLKR